VAIQLLQSGSLRGAGWKRHAKDEAHAKLQWRTGFQLPSLFEVAPQAASSLRSDTGFALEHGGVCFENQIVETFAIFRIPRYP
jgi:hypothetical protein